MSELDERPFYDDSFREYLGVRPIEGIINLSDEEVIQKLHDISNPIFQVRQDVENRLKDYMPKDDKEEFQRLLVDSNSTFYIDNENLEEIKSGEYELINFFRFAVTPFFYAYFFPCLKKIDEVIEKKNIINKVQIEYLKIFWSFWGIDEDLIKLFDYVQESEDPFKNSESSKVEKEFWESFEKAYFYSRENVIRVCNLFLKFNKEITARINNKEYTEYLAKDESSGFGFVYFIRNKDIYKIGITQNMLQRIDQLKPDELLDSVRCSNYKELEKEIHSKFKGCRIPQTEYFRLDKEEINQIHQILKDKAL